MTDAANAARSGPKPVDLWGIWDVDSEDWLGRLWGVPTSTPNEYAIYELAIENARKVVRDWPDSTLIVAHISCPANHRQTRVTATGAEEIRGGRTTGSIRRRHFRFPNRRMSSPTPLAMASS